MVNKDVVGVYNSLIMQMAKKIEKKVNIVYPYGSTNVILQDYFVTKKIYDALIKRRDYLVGGNLQWTQ